MDELEEVRYPWMNAMEFWAGGYWRELGALHLLLGWIFIVWMVIRACRDQHSPIEFRLAKLYFSLTIFTNYSYNLAGLNVNEILGIFAILTVLVRGRLRHGLSASRAARGLLLLFIVSLMHTLLSALVYPGLLPDVTTAITKIAVNVKILVLAANMAIVGTCVVRNIGLDSLIKSCVASGVIALLMYLLQMGVTLSGTLPYGTFLDAGFVGVPSFASVAIERGHMGKFIAPYFCFFLYAFLQWKWRWRFLLFVVVSAVNFSASGQVFLMCSLLIALLIFRRVLGIKAYVAGAVALAGMSVLIVSYWTVFDAIIDKIVTIAFQGDESQGGGRSLGLFLEYITAYPLGMGYSGSSLRTAPSLPEINAAHFAFLSQYSILAVPITLGFALLVISVVRSGLRGGVLGRCMAIGACMSVVIFLADILWFVPMVWLPIELLLSTRKRKSTEDTSEPSSALPAQSPTTSAVAP